MKVSNFVKSCAITALICLVLSILAVFDVRMSTTEVFVNSMDELNVFDCEVVFADVTETAITIENEYIAEYSGIAETEESKALEALKGQEESRKQKQQEQLLATTSADTYKVSEEVETVTTEVYVAEVAEEPVFEEPAQYEYTGSVLTAWGGVNYGPSGKETYYNLPMNGVVSIMRDCGFSEEEYPYWVREDGVKMLGPYVMVAANLSVHPRGTTVECSLGTALVCDTGGFAESNPTQLDIATDW